MRIVLDTNVVLSALLWRGTPYWLFDTVQRREQISLFTSPALLEELAKVLIRPAAAKRLTAIGRTASEVLADYIDAADLATPLTVAPVIAADPDDDQVLAIAMEVAADLVVSGDRHLLALGTYGSIGIVTPADALALIGA